MGQEEVGATPKQQFTAWHTAATELTGRKFNGIQPHMFQPEFDPEPNANTAEAVERLVDGRVRLRGDCRGRAQPVTGRKMVRDEGWWKNHNAFHPVLELSTAKIL